LKERRISPFTNYPIPHIAWHLDAIYGYEFLLILLLHVMQSGISATYFFDAIVPSGLPYFKRMVLFLPVWLP
jgi:hypothetical protein